MLAINAFLGERLMTEINKKVFIVFNLDRKRLAKLLVLMLLWFLYCFKANMLLIPVF